MSAEHVEYADRGASSGTAPEPMSDTVAPLSPAKQHVITSPSVTQEPSADIVLEDDMPSRSGPRDSQMDEDAASNASYLTPQSGSSATTVTSQTSEVASKSQERLPSIDDQIAEVTKLVQQPMRDKQKGYVISERWLTRVLARGTDALQKGKLAKDAMEGEIGPVDNTGLEMVTDSISSGFEDEEDQPFIPLKPALQMTEDFEVIPQEAWDQVIKWYGLAKGSPIITRYCHNTSLSETTENLQYELYPPILTVLKLPDRSAGTTHQTIREAELIPVKILASRHQIFQKFLKRAKRATGIDMKTKVRVWRLLGGLGGNSSTAGMLTPAQSRSASPAPNIALPVDPGQKLVLDVNTFVGLRDVSQRELLEAKDETTNEKYNGHRTVEMAGLTQDEVIVIEEQVGGPAGGEWVSDVAVSQSSRSLGVPISVTRNGSTTISNYLKPNANTSSGRTSPAPAGMMTRGRAQRNGRTRGTVGLGNLGNTCYMNSALQCVRSIEELTHYFLQDRYKKELNPRNPLSHNGEVAKAYASLLRDLYSENPSSSFAPRNFKQTIGKFGPSFSGYGQQDSQEFLLFLLDGLQEDLNRIHKKPYIEKPDSTDEMVHNPTALSEMADKCWDIYKARNDSVITDLFAGMYKSTVVCPICEKVSIIFDPFNNLTLQLPIENLWSRTIIFFPLYSRPIKVSVDIDKNATFKDLKEHLAKKVGIDARKTVLAEVYKQRFFKIYDDKITISEEKIVDADIVTLHELEDIPTNYPAPKKKGPRRAMLAYMNTDEDEDQDLPDSDSPLADKMLVSIFHRVHRDSSSRSPQKALFGAPSFIVLDREEAADYDAILKKVLAKVATMTTTDILRDSAQDSDRLDGSVSDLATSPQEDSDTVLMNTEDADSSSDSKIQANSVQSEDGMVDISMKDSADAPTVPRISYPPQASSVKSRRLPRMLQRGEFIEPELRRMFQMKYYSGKEMIPTCFNVSDESRTYPDIESRLPQTKQESKLRDKNRNVLTRRIQNGGSSTSSDEDDPTPDIYGQIEYAALHLNTFEEDGQAESDDDGLPPVQALANPSQGFSRFQKSTPRNEAGLITYSCKGKRPSTIEPDDEETVVSDTAEKGPLIKLGEAILLDWSSDAYEALFTGPEAADDAMRGSATWEEIPSLPDPELEQKRQQRSSRRKNGVSLGDCLDEFGKAEILSENDAWYCPRCKEHRRASKKFELWKSPDILVIHLKRFSAQGRFRDKLDVFVEFPVEGLDLSSRVAIQEEGKSPIYDLFAVDNHYGGLGGGHYTAYAQNFYDQNWYEYNDSMASKKSNPNSVITSAAYLLFYRRRSTKPLGGPFFESILSTSDDQESDDQLSRDYSRNESPSAQAGEGKRLGDFSRNGLSSALAGVGAAHQAGSGGVQDGVTSTGKTIAPAREPGLPDYSQELHDGEQTLESMEVDEEPAFLRLGAADAQRPRWGFGNLASADVGEDIEEPLFDDASTKAMSSGGNSSSDKRPLSDFEETWEETSLKYGTPEDSGLLEGELSMAVDEESLLLESSAMRMGMLPIGPKNRDEEEVVEVRLEEGEGERE